MRISRIFLIVTLLVVSLTSVGQVNDDSLRQVVLKANITDSLYVFGQWNDSTGTETHLRYLGTVETKEGRFKIMTSSWFWGWSRRATSRILVYDEKNKYLGNYYVGMTYDLPEKIENNRVVFLHSHTDVCDKEVITRLSFDKGIPEQFFKECKDGFGDIYSFEKE